MPTRAPHANCPHFTIVCDASFLRLPDINPPSLSTRAARPTHLRALTYTSGARHSCARLVALRAYVAHGQSCSLCSRAGLSTPSRMSSHRTRAHTQTPSIIALDWQAAQQQQHLVPFHPRIIARITRPLQHLLFLYTILQQRLSHHANRLLVVGTAHHPMSFVRLVFWRWRAACLPSTATHALGPVMSCHSCAGVPSPNRRTLTRSS